MPLICLLTPPPCRWSVSKGVLARTQVRFEGVEQRTLVHRAFQGGAERTRVRSKRVESVQLYTTSRPATLPLLTFFLSMQLLLPRFARFSDTCEGYTTPSSLSTDSPSAPGKNSEFPLSEKDADDHEEDADDGTLL